MKNEKNWLYYEIIQYAADRSLDFKPIFYLVVEEVKELLEQMGNTINEIEKETIVEVIMKEEEKIIPPEEAEEKAEVIAEVVKEAGPSMTVEEIEMIVESVNEADSIDTPEEVSNVTKLLEKVEGKKMSYKWEIHKLR